jgi:hypothetical protein
VHVLHETECLAETWASACCEADTRGELLGGCRPCRPRAASLRARGDTSKTSWFACECAALNKSAVRSWRPRLPGGVCKKAETSCPDLQARLWYTAQVWVRHEKATLSRALAASVSDVCSGHRPRTRPGWPRLHACDWLVLRACPAGDAFTVTISVVRSTWLLRAERASCIRSLGSSVRPRHPCPHASRCTRAVGVPGANDPVARVQLYYVNVWAYSNRYLCSAYALRSTIESSDHGGRGT